MIKYPIIIGENLMWRKHIEHCIERDQISNSNESYIWEMSANYRNIWMESPIV